MKGGLPFSNAYLWKHTGKWRWFGLENNYHVLLQASFENPFVVMFTNRRCSAMWDKVSESSDLYGMTVFCKVWKINKTMQRETKKLNSGHGGNCSFWFTEVLMGDIQPILFLCFFNFTGISKVGKSLAFCCDWLYTTCMHSINMQSFITACYEMKDNCVYSTPY